MLRALHHFVLHEEHAGAHLQELVPCDVGDNGLEQGGQCAPQGQVRRGSMTYRYSHGKIP